MHNTPIGLPKHLTVVAPIPPCALTEKYPVEGWGGRREGEKTIFTLCEAWGWSMPSHSEQLKRGSGRCMEGRGAMEKVAETYIGGEKQK